MSVDGRRDARGTCPARIVRERVQRVCVSVVGYSRGMVTLHVGLVADPASPTQLAHRIKDLDPPKGEQHGTWSFEVVSEPFTTGCEDVDTALARLGDHGHEHEWDLVVGLTELPLRDDDGRYLLIEVDPQRRTALLS